MSTTVSSGNSEENRERDEFIGIVAAYKHLLINLKSNPSTRDLNLPNESQKLSIKEAKRDFDCHNRMLNMKAESVDLIKCMSFMGCHLLTWLSDTKHLPAVASVIVSTLDSLAQDERGDTNGMTPNHLKHISRLIQLEAINAHKKAESSIWGHGYWRVGLYMSFLTASKCDI